MPRSSLYTRGNEDRRSLYNYAADSYVPPTPASLYEKSVRTRSASREPSVSRSYRAHSISSFSGSYRLRMQAVDKDVIVCILQSI